MFTSVYESWPNGPSTEAAYFPIGVWVQSPANAAAYREIGINLYVGLWQGPTQQQLDDLTAAGMQTICSLNGVGRQNLDNSTIVAWMHGDEPDNAQADGQGGWGDAISPAVIQTGYDSLSRVDPSRPIWLNLGQGVANDDWVGRAAPREDYPGYVAGTDIVSFDVYPVSGIRKEDGERFLWYVAKGVDSLRVWSDGRKIVWNVIETTRINADRGPTPDQVRSEVWMSIIHGSQGIVYFAHEWNPVFREARLLEDEAMRQGVGRINAQIHRLAPVLNAGTGSVQVSVATDPSEIPVDVMVREANGELYVFAVSMRQEAASATFSLVGGDERDLVEVVDEDRSLQLTQGSFTDHFTPYEVHIYRLSR
ncbi:MAG: hypothetical protein HOB49_10460 [Gemmatimonadetes bacterium]|nr:hypothetical protein [Gemmatimonadota bacterium]MBT6627424.1 hypothetical protein [Gemmatimonadota bacterium]MBT7457194.1 hypothetical protein [Gemmatimonadota bacterium]